MSEAVFALVGALIGVFGALAGESISARREDRRHHKQALQTVGADFIGAIARIRQLAYDIHTLGPSDELTERMRAAHEEARAHYERLRLISDSLNAQEQGRYVLRYALGIWRQADGLPPRDDEQSKGPLVQLDERLTAFCTELRRECGVKHPERVFPEPSALIHWPEAGRRLQQDNRPHRDGD